MSSLLQELVNIAEQQLITAEDPLNIKVRARELAKYEGMRDIIYAMLDLNYEKIKEICELMDEPYMYRGSVEFTDDYKTFVEGVLDRREQRERYIIKKLHSNPLNPNILTTIGYVKKHGDTSLSHLGLSERTYIALRDSNITELTELYSLSDGELLDLPGIGRACLLNIQERLSFYNIYLRE